MPRTPFREKLEKRIAAAGSRLCVGLDVRVEHALEPTKQWLMKFIDQTAPYAAAYKPNSAYFEALGWRGVRLLEMLVREIPQDIPVILDVKRGDIGETQAYYAKAAFELLNADAVTLNPYMGRDTLEPFLQHTDRGLYLLGVTSNPGAADIELQRTTADGGRQIFEIVAGMTQASPQVGLVLGLTNAAPEVLQRIPDVPLLIPGLGAQGGDLAALKSGAPRTAPLLVNVSRGLLYHGQEGRTHADVARDWRDKIEAALAGE